MQNIRLLKVIIESRTLHILISAGTDGRIALWDITNAIEELRKILSVSRINKTDPTSESDNPCNTATLSPVSDYVDETRCSDSSSDTSSDSEDETMARKIFRVGRYTLGSVLNSSNTLIKDGFEPFHVFKAHQSGVHAVDVYYCGDGKWNRL